VKPVKTYLLVITCAAFLMGIILSLIWRSLDSFIVSILTSIVAAGAFYFFQIYIPNLNNRKKGKLLYFDSIKKMLITVRSKVFAYEVIQTSTGFKIPNKFVFYKTDIETKELEYTFFNYLEDSKLFCIHYDNLLKKIEEYFYRFGDTDIKDIYYGLSNCGFKSIIKAIFVNEELIAFYKDGAISPEYLSRLKDFKVLLDKLENYLEIDIKNFVTEIMTNSEIEKYCDIMRSIEVQSRSTQTQALIYFEGVLPRIRKDNHWCRIFDINIEKINPGDYK
jgi:hypothetical protein